MLCGELTDTFSLYNSHRVFVARSRVSRRAGRRNRPPANAAWVEEWPGPPAAPASDPEAFANCVVALYRSEDQWNTVRHTTAERIRNACGYDVYERTIAHILGGYRN